MFRFTFFCGLIFMIFGNAYCDEEDFITIPLVRSPSPRRMLMASGVDMDQVMWYNSPNLKRWDIETNEIGVHPENIIRPGISDTNERELEGNENSNNDKISINDTLAIYKYLDNEYYGIIRIGNPSREFRVILDTAWGHTWVVSKNCPITSLGCMGANKYDSSRSSTYHANGNPFSAGSVDSGSLQGYFSNDDFYIGHMRVNNTMFGEATQVPWVYLFSKGDGVLGLGYKRLTAGDSVPIFYEIINQRLIKNPVFSFYINRDPTTEHAGVLVFGDSGTKHINGPFTYLNVTRKAYWQFAMEKVYVNFGGNRSYTFCQSGCEAIADTSTNVIAGPPAEIDKINQLISATKLIFGRNEVNCGLVRKMPHISFKLGNKNFTIHGQDIIEEMLWRGFKICLSVFTHSEFTGKDANIWALGGALLSKFYTTFDLGKNRVGFAMLR